MEHPVACSLLLLLLVLGCVSAQQEAPSPADAAPTAGQQSSGGDKVSFFRAQNQKNDKKTTVADGTTTPAPQGGTVLYRQLAKDGSTCTLIRTDGLLTFTYRDKINEITESDMYMPEDITISGHCHMEDSSLVTMRWGGSYTLNWFFEKTPGGERWYMEKMELKFNTSERLFQHFPKQGRAIKLITSKESMLFPTPVGKSYQCAEETTVQFEGSKDISATVLLRDLKLQPFIFKNDEFGPEFVCSPGSKSYRDERAPLAVGTTLAIVTLLTVAGYGIYRYVKIKKVQYDNVE